MRTTSIIYKYYTEMTWDNELSLPMKKQWRYEYRFIFVPTPKRKEKD